MTKTVLDFQEVYKYAEGLQDIRRALKGLSSFTITSESALENCYTFALSSKELGAFYVHYYSPFEIRIHQEWTGASLFTELDGLKDYIYSIEIISYKMLDRQ